MDAIEVVVIQDEIAMERMRPGMDVFSIHLSGPQDIFKE